MPAQPPVLPSRRAVIIYCACVVTVLAAVIMAAFLTRPSRHQLGGVESKSPSVVKASGRVYKGLKLEEWVKRLYSVDVNVAGEAAKAIATYGAEGVPHLLLAMRSPNMATRFGATLYFPPDQAAAFQAELQERLRRLQQDREQEVRSAARVTWARCGFLLD